MADILNTAVSGLLAYRTALSTTSNNISNVNTEGYTRQRVLLETNPAEVVSQGSIGTGVNVASIERIISEFDTKQINQYQSSYSRLGIMSELATRVESVVSDIDSSLTPSMDSFFNAVNDVSNDPAAIAPRQVMLAEGEILTERFQFLSSELQSLDEEVDQRLRFVVAEVNGLARDIANVNESILQSRALANITPADLLDKQDLLLKQLSEKVEAKVLKQSDGTINVFVGTGQLLVSSGVNYELLTNANAIQPDRLSVYLDSGFATADISSNLTGGELGGLLAFRTNLLDPAHNRLGRIAMSVAETVNQQHRAGIDLEGNQGDNFFNASSQSAIITNNTAAADILVEMNNSTALQSSGYRLDYTDDGINPAFYTVTRLSDQSTQTFAAALPSFTVDGMTITPSGVVADGESFVIQAGQPLAQVFAHQNNAAGGSLEVQVTDVMALTVSDYTLDLRNGSYTLTRLYDGADVTPTTGPPFEVDGLLIIPTGMSDGDSYHIRPTRNGADGLSVAVGGSEQIAAASPYRVSTNVNNIGNANIELLNVDGDQLNFLDYPAVITGGVVLAPFNYSAVGNDATFDLTIDGITRTVTVNQDATTDLDGDTIVDLNDTVFAVQSAINTAFSGAGDPGATVSLFGNQLRISSDTSGNNSSLAITNSNAITNVQLGLNAETATGDQFTANIVFKDATLPATGIVFDVLDAAGNLLTDNSGTLLSDISYTTGTQISVGAWTVQLTGTPVADDRLQVGFNQNATQDNRNMLSMIALESQSILDGNTSTYSQAYQSLIVEVGTQTSQININRDADDVLLNNAIAKREERSGVNLDEEAADLIRFQQAYTAITRVIQTSRTLFDSLLSAI